MKIATIHLQRNRKAKMMQVEFFSSGRFKISISLKRRLPPTTKGSIQMINTLTWAKFGTATGGRDIRNCSACPSAKPGAARRDQISVPLRLHGALLQHPAGRRGFAAMPAEEHDEPLVELPERGARRGSACGGTRQAGRDRSAESRGSCGRNSSAGEICRAKGCSGSSRRTADQRTDFRHPQRMPLRLSKSLRGRADWRRAGPAMPGKEQGETLGRLRESRLRRQRGWSSSGCTCGRRGSGRSGSGCRRCTGGADRDRAAADAAA